VASSSWDLLLARNANYLFRYEEKATRRIIIVQTLGEQNALVGEEGRSKTRNTAPLASKPAPLILLHALQLLLRFLPNKELLQLPIF